MTSYHDCSGCASQYDTPEEAESCYRRDCPHDEDGLPIPEFDGRAKFANEVGRCDYCGGWDSWHAFGLVRPSVPEWLCEACVDAELNGELDERATMYENETGGGASE